MIYQYHCPQCDWRFDVVKSAMFMERPESCVKCKDIAIREFVPSRIYFNGTKVEHAEYNPGLGCIVRNKSHRKELCKIKNVEEIGNEPPERLHKYFDKKREDMREESWAELDKGWVGNGE